MAIIALHGEPLAFSDLVALRRLFGHVFAMKYEPEIDHLKNWFYAERDSGHGLSECVKIAEFVWQAKKYSDEEKVQFLARKGTCLYNRGKNDLLFSFESGLRDIRDSLICHLTCFKLGSEAGFLKMEKSEEYAKNTAFYLFNFLVAHGRYDDFFDTMLHLCERKDLVIDPIEDGFVQAAGLMLRERVTKGEMQKMRGRLDYVRRELERKSQWFDSHVKDRVVQAAVTTIDSLARLTETKRQEIPARRG